MSSEPLVLRRSSLPAVAYVFHEQALPGERIVALRRGVQGYWRTSLDDPSWSDQEAHDEVARLNATLGVAAVHLRTMLAGCLFGFEVPAADPRNEPPPAARQTAGGAGLDPTNSLLRMFALRAAAI